jgi:hypothetical protein
VRRSGAGARRARTYVHIFATKLNPSYDVRRPDHAGVTWHHADTHDRDQPASSSGTCSSRSGWCVLPREGPARLRILWNQDLLIDGPMKLGIMAHAWAFDRSSTCPTSTGAVGRVLVPELTGLGYVTKNGFDPALVPEGVTKAPHRVIHISRPERGLRPLLAMWPAVKAKRAGRRALSVPLLVDVRPGKGWGRKSASATTRPLARCSRRSAGSSTSANSGRPTLYHAIAASAVMWYPGVVDFAETSCIAAIEAQACGTPFVGSWKGALPETVPSGVLIQGRRDKDARLSDGGRRPCSRIC